MVEIVIIYGLAQYSHNKVGYSYLYPLKAVHDWVSLTQAERVSIA